MRKMNEEKEEEEEEEEEEEKIRWTETRVEFDWQPQDYG